jgi:hypothetical protein
MNDLIDPTKILLGIFGASCVELLSWHNIKRNLSQKKYEKLIKSPGYWIITIITVIFSAIGVCIIYYRLDRTPWEFAIAGAAFPTLFDKAMKVLASRTDVMGGVGDDAKDEKSILLEKYKAG